MNAISTEVVVSEDTRRLPHRRMVGSSTASVRGTYCRQRLNNGFVSLIRLSDKRFMVLLKGGFAWEQIVKASGMYTVRCVAHT